MRMKTKIFYDPKITFQLDLQDSVEWLRTILPESLDLVITDPAYESPEKHRKVGTTTRLKKSKSSSNEWFEIFRNERFHELFTELYRAMKPSAHAYVFCDQETLWHLVPAAVANGFKFWKFIVWDKMKIGMGYHFRARHELILEFTKGPRPELELPDDVDLEQCFIDPRYELVCFFEKGKRKLSNLGIPDVLSFPRVHKGYPTEKPWELLQVLVQQSSLPGEIVADPFFGSASAGEAALRNGRVFRGCDISHDAMQVGTDRLELVTASC
jgi:site-specific DNA-methyltransferase (adenine-specific)